jgi:hypothetical protein
VLFAGAALGLASAKWAVDAHHDFSTRLIGPWQMRLDTGEPGGDPYLRASVARSGEITLGPGEGLELVAEVDSEGRGLDGRCAYTLSGREPPGRHWTLSLRGRDGRPFANAAGRHGFTSAEVLREAGGGIAVTVSAEAAAGDWLPAPAQGGFVLVLRLYDPPSGAAEALGVETLPRIARGDCRT